MPDQHRVLIIIPCYNEAETIGSLLREIQALEKDFDVLVIDDGSHDSTASIAEQMTHCIRLQNNQGIGRAVQAGLRYACDNAYDICIRLDGDGQHPPAQITALLAAYESSPAGMIIGSRYLDHQGAHWGWKRIFGSKIISSALVLLFGKPWICDPTSGMRLIDKNAMALFCEHYPSKFPEPLSIAQALTQNLRIYEIGVNMRFRAHGRSSIRGLRGIYFMLYVLWELLRLKIRPRH